MNCLLLSKSSPKRPPPLLGQPSAFICPVRLQYPSSEFLCFHSALTVVFNKLCLFLNKVCTYVSLLLYQSELSEVRNQDSIFCVHVCLPLHLKENREWIYILFLELNLVSKEIRLDDFWGPFQLYMPRFYSQKAVMTLSDLMSSLSKGAQSAKDVSKQKQVSWVQPSASWLPDGTF